jgi:hypothetical protein
LILRFFHLAGFRRVGRTSFVGFALCDASHPSRTLPIEQDAPLLIEGATDSDREPDVAEMATKYPLHSAIANMKDEDAVKFLQTSFAADPASIHVTDFAGNTPLHIAAVMGKVQVVRQLLVIGGPQDANVMNKAGSTPLEQLQRDLLNTREFFNAMIAGGIHHILFSPLN